MQIFRNLYHRIRFRGQRDLASAISGSKIAICRYCNSEIRWLLTNRGDHIQDLQSQHGFYELEWLESIREHLGSSSVVVDIGANVGNHAIYFISQMQCSHLHAFEPNKPAREHLFANLALNETAATNIHIYPVAVGEENTLGQIVPGTKFNLGKAGIAKCAKGEVPIVKGDEVLRNVEPDLIKIDVEGMEIDVLRGLQETLRRCSPNIAIEVCDTNRAKFDLFVREHDYEVILEQKAYEGQKNILICPMK